MRTLTILALMALTLPASAQQVPRFDVEASCRNMAEMAGNSEFMYGACFDQEQGAYNSLKPMWARLPGTMRSNCKDMAQMAGGTYFMLKACVDQELDAMRANQGRDFQF